MILDTDIFQPQPWARGPHTQSIFASLRWRALGKNPMANCAREMIIETDQSVHLLSYYSRQPADNGKGLVLLIHGWEGSSDSTYMLSTGRFLFNKGYDILRLNLRDHGDSHHLNEGLFHSALIEEVFDACGKAAPLAQGRPYVIAGFSLGGNFALRIAMRHSNTPIAGLKQVVAVSPVLNPFKATLMIDRGSMIYSRYFLKKWRSSLKKKQALFPDLYRFDDILKLKSCLAITEQLIPCYTEFGNYREYFDQYTITGGAFHDLEVPLMIIASTDDPVLGPEDIHDLSGNDRLHISIQSHGGHCGFLEPFPFGCWYERKLYQMLETLK